MEIERKFLVDDPPDLEGCEPFQIHQGYLALPDDQGGAEVRLRRKDDQLLLTVKGGSGRVRTEEEFELARERFDSLWPLTEGRRISKRRYRIPVGEVTAEVDFYGGELDGLVTAEVEFESEADADRFEAPEWFGRELTGDKRYMNESLAIHGKPGG